MLGSISTSLNKFAALSFVPKNPKQGKTPVFQEILWKNKWGNYLRLNDSTWTAYKSEKEVLLRDGQEFRVLKVIPNYQIQDQYKNLRTVTFI